MQKLLLLIVGMVLGSGLVFLVGRHTEKNPFYAGPAGGVEAKAKTVYLFDHVGGDCSLEGKNVKVAVPSGLGLDSCYCTSAFPDSKLVVRCRVTNTALASTLGEALTPIRRMRQGEALFTVDQAVANSKPRKEDRDLALVSYDSVEEYDQRDGEVVITGTCMGQPCRSTVYTNPLGYVVTLRFQAVYGVDDDVKRVFSSSGPLMSAMTRSLTLTD